MKKSKSLYDFFEKTGTYINMTRTEKKIVDRKLKNKNHENNNKSKA